LPRAFVIVDIDAFVPGFTGCPVATRDGASPARGFFAKAQAEIAFTTALIVALTRLTSGLRGDAISRFIASLAIIARDPKARVLARPLFRNTQRQVGVDVHAFESALATRLC
jgi:hypothetical protein